jgi:hypothetical protein
MHPNRSNPAACRANWSGDDLLRDVGSLLVDMILWLANFLYDGIYAAAFPIRRWEVVLANVNVLH